MGRLDRIALAVAGVILAAGSTAFAADQNVAAAEMRLAGASSKQWILTKVVVFMDVAAGQKCRQGETYAFNAQHQVDITQCINGRLQHTKGPWSITATGPLDLVLTVPGRAYYLSFTDDPKKTQVRLRDRDPGIAKLTQDRILTLSDD